jgi:hypothetical protein
MMDTKKLKELTGTTAIDRPLVTIDEFSVEEAKSSRPLWSRPIPKFGMAVLLLSPVVAIAGMFLTGGGHVEQEIQVALASPDQAQAKQGVAQDQEQMQREIARLKAKSALDGQEKLEKQLTKQPSNKPVKAVQKSNPKAVVPAVPKPNSALSVQPPPPRIANMPTPSLPAPRMPLPVSRPAIPVREPRLVQRVSEVEESIDPQKRWQALATVGSYGSVRPEVSRGPEFSRGEVAGVPPGSVQPSTKSPELQATLATWDRQDTAVVPTIEEEKTPTQSASLMAGTRAAGLLETPLVLDEGQWEERFTIGLSESIPDSTGKLALPANTRLIAKVEGVSPTGRVQLSAMIATWNQDGQTKEMSLPAGAVQIRGNQGQPLMAQQFDNKGKELAALDRGQFLLSAVRGASGQLIQPNTKVQTNNNSTIVTQENQRPNILAGALQSGADSLLATIIERNKQAAEAIQNRPPIRHIPAGTAVEVFINQSVQLPI